jgi:inner membrane protein
MDNLTHTLTGLALARTGLKRLTPGGTLLILIAANIPDIDMLSWLKNRWTTFEMHRGYTHSLIGLPFVALLPVILTALFMRKRLPWRTAWFLSCIGVASHFLLDWSMSYGVRFLLPFSSSWFHLDIYSLIDWVLLAVLLIACLAPALSRLVSDEIGARRGEGRGTAVFALCFIVLYGGFRAAMHARVMSQLQSRIYDNALGSPATRMAAFPHSANPLAWSGIVEGEHSYRLYDLSAYGNFDPHEGELLYKMNWNTTLQRVSLNPAFQYALYFSQFPYWQKTPDQQNLSTVSMTDLRFGRPGESFFKLNASVDSSGQVQEVWFGGGVRPVE